METVLGEIRSIWLLDYIRMEPHPLEPDTVNGMAYLEAIKSVFKIRGDPNCLSYVVLFTDGVCWIFDVAQVV